MKKSEKALLQELRSRLPDPGDQLTPHRDGRRPWTLDPLRGGQPVRGWAAQTFYDLAAQGLIVIQEGFAGSVRISLAKQVHALTGDQQKALDRLAERIKNSQDGSVSLQPGPHRMRYLPGDVLGRKEQTYLALQQAGYISIGYGSSGSLGAWFVRLAGEGVA